MKIITAHIKKACAEKRIIMEKIKKNVSNIKIKDPGSAITHFIAMLMALFAATPLIIKALSAPDTIHVISLSIFIGTMILLYAASTTYHTVNATPGINKILKKLDHCMISVMIAGSYTPVCLIVLHNRTGYLLLSVVWLVALFGILLKLCWINCPKWVSSILYIVMGWACLLAFPQIIHALPKAAFAWLLAGGLIYTAGGIIYALKVRRFNEKHRMFGTHEIFHLFVMGGSICHYVMMYRFVA